MFNILSQGQRRGGAIDAVDTVKVEKESLRKATANHLSSTSSSSSKEPLPLIGSIDQGTSSSRFILFSTLGSIVAWSQVEHKQIFPSDGDAVTGWHEHDPLEIWNNVVACIAAVVQAMDYELASESPLPIGDRVLPTVGYTIKAIGITNQRETTISWNAKTGKCYYNAIVWDDTRTNSVANHLATSASSGSLMAMASGQSSDDFAGKDPKDRLRAKTGLPLASYFAGTKVKWLLDHVEELQRDMMTQPENVRFGTVDCWILYQLTGVPINGDSKQSQSPSKGNTFRTSGGNVGGLFLTDVSNASRWLFLDIQKVEWDPKLVSAVCSPHNVPLSALPEVRPSSQVYAKLRQSSTGISKLDGVPVASILGDQQAALFGQAAYDAGEAKNTYGTGMFLMMNTGTTSVYSHHGLLTTIAYQLADGKVHYALEGSVSHSGSTIQWLRDQLEMLENASESERLATDHNDGLYLVPAFAGLFAPHWRSDARGCIVGITAAHHKGHIVRAALEAAAYQAREVFDAIYADSRVLLKELKVDGGGSHNSLLMQFQADMIHAPVVIPQVQETTAMGAAFAAGLAVGVWKDLEEVKSLWRRAKVFAPLMSETERSKNWAGWRKAISRSLDWVESDDDNEYFLDAETFSHDDDDSEVIAAEPSTAKKQTEDSRGKKSSAAIFESAGISTAMSLMAVALIGAGAGFILGRRRH